MRQGFFTTILNYILVLLGFATTTSSCEYGTLAMDFEVSGRVDNQDLTPIAGIKVSAVEDDVTALTSEDGSFFISGTGMGAFLKFEDIDGPENGGEYAVKTEEVKVEQVEKGSGHWYKGNYEAREW